MGICLDNFRMNLIKIVVLVFKIEKFSFVVFALYVNLIRKKNCLMEGI